MNDSDIQSILAELANQPAPTRLKHLRLALVQILSGNAPAAERAEAGRVLGEIGDPRPGVLSCDALEFCHVPAGEFIFGEGYAQKKINLPEFWISKYPVTQAQFGEFIRSGGYTQPRYWPEAAQAGCWAACGFKGGYDIAAREAPPDYGGPFNLPNHPVVGVTWYEATAFARWFSEQVPDWAQGQNGLFWQNVARVSLPGDEQWEKAARGPFIPHENPRGYPWGEKFDPDRANAAPTGLGATTAVGCFPGGTSPCGALDLGGNAWEWTASRFDAESAHYVLRGGSFSGHPDYTRCSCRYKLPPDALFIGTGFRVVTVGRLL
jgi:formylglycine-generating enzyme required for sulfatase activity